SRSFAGWLTFMKSRCCCGVSRALKLRCWIQKPPRSELEPQRGTKRTRNKNQFERTRFLQTSNHRRAHLRHSRAFRLSLVHRLLSERLVDRREPESRRHVGRCRANGAAEHSRSLESGGADNSRTISFRAGPRTLSRTHGPRRRN